MIAIVTGSGGLIGSEATKFLLKKGYEVVGIDNDMRSYFFGENASTKKTFSLIEKQHKNYTHKNLDIRDSEKINDLFSEYGNSIEIIVHTAAQPSHDWAARAPLTDFTVNANGTLNLLEATRKFSPKASFIFTSTNKVYGDTPNYLPLKEMENRWTLDEKHPFSKNGIDESMSIDRSKHSIFGASKVAADILVQEYGLYFGMHTVSFRGGCLTGPAHQGAELHGFLSYLVQCAVQSKPYKIFGYKGKQVRDNIHSFDLINAFWHFHQNPRQGEVYNIGGGTHANISVLEAIQMIKDISGHTLKYEVLEQNRSGDHIWYISDVNKFKSHYPNWHYTYDMQKTITEIINAYEN